MFGPAKWALWLMSKQSSPEMDNTGAVLPLHAAHSTLQIEHHVLYCFPALNSVLRHLMMPSCRPLLPISISNPSMGALTLIPLPMFSQNRLPNKTYLVQCHLVNLTFILLTLSNLCHLPFFHLLSFDHVYLLTVQLYHLHLASFQIQETTQSSRHLLLCNISIIPCPSQHNFSHDTLSVHSIYLSILVCSCTNSLPLFFYSNSLYLSTTSVLANAPPEARQLYSIASRKTMGLCYARCRAFQN